MRTLILSVVLSFIFSAAAYSQELKPELKPNEVTITNTVASKPILAKPVDLDDISNVVAVKEAKRKARIEANRQLDLEYKAIPNKPSKWRHPLKRSDLWIDYHQDSYRKYRTRVLPASQGGGIIMSAIFSAVAAFR